MDAFAETNHVTFPYFNGARTVHGDPLRIQNAYLREFSGENLDQLALAAKSPDIQTRLAADEKLGAAVRSAFALVPFDGETGEGMTDSQVLALWVRFAAWQDSLVASAEPVRANAEVDSPPAPESTPASSV